MRHIALLFLAIFFPVAAALGADGARPAVFAMLSEGETARVRAVIDGDTVALEGGREVRLVGIQAPKLPLGRPNFREWPLAQAAKAALEDIVAGREVLLGYGDRREDRYGRLLAHLAAGEVWVQGQMLELGMARVYTFADNRRLVAEMLALEEAARAAGRGIWADPFYRILSAAEVDAKRDAGTFQLVEGRVVDAARVGRYVYLNFGSDYRSDFTAVILPEARKLFGPEGPDPAAYAGRRVRVRGWIESFNGPMIEVTHPEQIELLE